MIFEKKGIGGGLVCMLIALSNICLIASLILVYFFLFR
jgi:hypothetical protein